MKNEPAFPVVAPGADSYPFAMAHGLTKLEYFAAAALTGTVANDAALRACVAGRKPDDVGAAVALVCYSIAEAMLAESEKRNRRTA